MGPRIEYLFLYSIVFAFIACNEKQKPIEYDSEILDNKEVSNATLIKIETDIEFGNPLSIEFISDSLMVIYDSNINDYMAHIVTIDGRYINSFGRKGHGDGELLSPINLTLSEQRDSAFIYDFMLQRMVGFDLNRVIKKQEQQPSVIEFDINSIPNQEYRFTHVKSGPNGSMLGFSCCTNRIVSMKDGKVQYIYSEYPQVDPDTETNWSIWNYSQDRKSLSPDRSKLVIATYVGGLFEIFVLNKDLISSRIVKGFYKPDYTYADGAIPKCVTPNPETMITGFKSIDVGNHNFAAIIDGPNASRCNEILLFDFNGILTKRIVVNNGIMERLGRNEHEDIYCIAYDNDFKELNLYHIETQ